MGSIAGTVTKGKKVVINDRLFVEIRADICTDYFDSKTAGGNPSIFADGLFGSANTWVNNILHPLL